MAEPISIQQLKDASEDAITLADFIYKPANVMIPRRLAADINSLQYYLDYMSSYAQHSYETYDEMVANAVNLPNGVSAFVTNDLDATKNGIYTYNGTSFVKGDYQPENVAKDYVEAKLGGLQVFDGKVRAQDVSTADGVTQDIKNEDFKNKLDALPFEGGVLADTFVVVDGSLSQRTINKGLESIADLSTIKNPKSGLRVYVNSISSFYTYKSESSQPANGVTVVNSGDGFWEIEDKSEYLASWFATPNVKTSQALALQAGYDYATSKGKPFIVDDLFYVDGRAQDCSLPSGDRCAVLIRSNSILDFGKKGKFKVLPNSYSNYHVLIACNSVDNYKVNEPRLSGDRLEHTYGDGSNEWGYGLTIYESSNGLIENPVIDNMTGDGLYVGKAWMSTLTTVPTNIVVNNPVIDRVRRNGISLCGYDNLYISNPTITNVKDIDGITATNPKSGLDFEVEGNNSYARNGVIHNSTIADCDGGIDFTIAKENTTYDLVFTGVTTITNSINKHISCYSPSGVGKVGLIRVESLMLESKVAPVLPDIMLGIASGTVKLELLGVHKATSVGFGFRGNLSTTEVKHGGIYVETSGSTKSYVTSFFNTANTNVLLHDIVFVNPLEFIDLTDAYKFSANYMITKTASQANNETYNSQKLHSNNIDCDLYAGNPSVISMDAKDNRRLLISKAYKSVAATTLSINGLNIITNSGTFTTASTIQVGASLEFTNTGTAKGTVIHNIQGVWNFTA